MVFAQADGGRLAEAGPRPWRNGGAERPGVLRARCREAEHDSAYTFKSPNRGPAGRVEGSAVTLFARPSTALGAFPMD
jgi:hypothetical protein